HQRPPLPPYCLAIAHHLQPSNSRTPLNMKPIPGITKARTSSEIHELASLPQPLGGCLEHPHSAQPRRSIVEWVRTVCDALDEICKFVTQRLSLFQMRRPHVARSITHEEFIETFTAIHLYSLVIDLNLFIGFEIVP